MTSSNRRYAFIHDRPSEITPHNVYLRRRQMIQALAGGAAGTAMALWAMREALAQTARPGKLAALPSVRSSVAGAATMEKLTEYKDASTYNNFTATSSSLSRRTCPTCDG